MKLGLHPVEGFDIGQLELHGLGAGESHCQNCETVTGKVVITFINLPADGIFLNDIHGLKIKLVNIIRDFKIVDCLQNILVLLAENVGNFGAGCNGLIVDDLDDGYYLDLI